MISDKEIRDRLLKNVKREVKQMMEEAVTRKFIHEESSSITSLCGAVEACVQYGLKKRALGLFKHNNTTSALLAKISKNYPPATQVTKLLNDLDVNANEAKKSVDNNKNQTGNLKKPTTASYNPKYLWIRLALFEKVLAGIMDHLVENNSKYYEKESVVADPVDGPILASLLVGPCALDFTKMKTTDHFWTDPPADELVQRHRIHSSANHFTNGPGSPRKLGLQVRRNTSSTTSEEAMRATPLSAKEYVESLHQNSKTTLLYGKNNVIVQPKEDVERMAGYLSLHQCPDGLSVKWTPNQLMNGCCEMDEAADDVDRSLYWEYAVTVYLDEIVYLHCHQQPDSGGTIVLVGQDGVQRPPIHFPKGGHLLAFLSCLETGLLPHGQLDPPLWSQRGKGKVFPKLRRKGSRPAQDKSDSIEEAPDMLSGDPEEATDYVFRIISTFNPEALHCDLMEGKSNGLKNGNSGSWTPRDKLRHTSSSSSTSSTTSIQSYAKTQQQVNATLLLGQGQGQHHRCAVKQLCDTMKRQIISRAFYGWLAHCRHLKTVRTHLSGLVNHVAVTPEQLEGASKGLTADIWNGLMQDGETIDVDQVYRLVYFGGVEHSIRKEVWPFLLGYYKFGSTQEELETLAAQTRQQYENTMSEWLAVEAIVHQRDKEIMAANFAKMSSESQDGQIPLVRKDSSLSNDVFEDNISMTSDDMNEEFQGTDEADESFVVDGSIITGVAEVDSVADSSPWSIPDASPKLSPDEGVGDMKAISAPQCVEGTVEGTVVEQHVGSIIVTNPSVDSGAGTDAGDGQELTESLLPSGTSLEKVTEVLGLEVDVAEALLNASRESLVSPASPASNGGIYSTEMLENVALNLHRIDKDVQRCDRNYHYFTRTNLEKVKNVMCTYVWEHLEVGYVQGMCDLVAPLLVIFDDEVMAYSCFCELMKRMAANFPHGGAMDVHFANMRSLIQILDSELFEHMHQNGDYTHFYFSYRWFLLDFKRELVYDDVFSVWETIWAARYVSSNNFVLFIALALVEYYREIILDNNMDFTDIIKFFNEMAERHNAKQVLKISRDLVHRLQDLIENK